MVSDVIKAISGPLQAASLGASIAAATTRPSKKVFEANERLIDKSAKINAGRIGREMKYQMDLARTELATQGGMHGSNAFLMAANARRAEENRQNVFIQAEQRKAQQVSATPPLSGIGAVTSILGATARFASDRVAAQGEK